MTERSPMGEMERLVDRTLRRSDGAAMCNDCCWGDRCDEPRHVYRTDCKTCGGTGDYLLVLLAKAREVDQQRAADTASVRELSKALRWSVEACCGSDCPDPCRACEQSLAALNRYGARITIDDLAALTPSVEEAQ